MSALSQSQLFLREAIDLIGSTTVLGVNYGIAFTLYCLCARSLYLQLQKPDKRKEAKISLVCTTFAFCCATAYLALDARKTQLAYINHANDYPGGPLEYELTHGSATDPYLVAASVFNFLLEILTMGAQIWRLQAIWSGTRYAVTVIILPVILLVSFIALYIPIGAVGAVMPFAKMGIPLHRAVAITIATYTVMAAFAVLVTGLILGRLWVIRKSHIASKGLSEGSKLYMGIVPIAVESFVMVSIWSVATAISTGVGSPIYFMFTANDSHIKIIAYYLVVYRVANGRGWDKDTEHKLSNLQWNNNGQEATGVRSRVPAAMIAAGIGSRPVSHPEVTV